MCENIKIEIQGEDYEDCMYNAMAKCKDQLPETTYVFRDPDDCGQEDWFLKHSECELSAGGTVLGGIFVFTRNYEEEV